MIRLDEFLALWAAEAEAPRDRLLARQLDAALRADRAVPGSAEQVIHELPARAQAELRRLLQLARALSASAPTVAPSAAFRHTSRQRLLAAMTANAARSGTEPLAQTGVRRPAAPLVVHQRPVARVWLARRSRAAGRWLARAAAGLTAVASTGLVTVNAAASTLPGEPLYAVKEAREALSVQLAPSDEARAAALLQRADARLDETARLVRQGRTAEAAQTARRCDEALAAANVTLQEVGGPAAEQAQVELVGARLAEQREQLATLLDAGPQSERTDLESAPDESVRGRRGAEEAPLLAVIEASPTATAAALRGGVQPRVLPTQPVDPPSTRPEPTTAPAIVEAVEGDDGHGRAPQPRAADQSGPDRAETSPGPGAADPATRAQAETEDAPDDVPAAVADTPGPPASQRRTPRPGSGRPGQVPAAPPAPPVTSEDQHDAEEHGPAEMRIGERGGGGQLSETGGRTRPPAQPMPTAPVPAQSVDGDRRTGSPTVDGSPATPTAAPTPTPRPAGGAQNGGGSSQSGQPGQTVQTGRAGGGQSSGGSGSQNRGGGGGSGGGDAKRGGDQQRTSDLR